MKRSRASSSLVAGFLVIYCLMPLLWLVRLSLSPEKDINSWPFKIFPSFFTLTNYIDIIFDSRFWLQLLNSLFVCGASTTMALVFGALGAYGITRFEFGFKNALLVSLLGLHLLPGMANMTAVYQVAGFLGAYNSQIFIAVLKAGGVTLAIWILITAFNNVPQRLEHSARIDGYSRFFAMIKVTLPLAGPGILTAGLLLFIQSWNTFFLPFLILDDSSKMTLTVGLFQYFSEHGFEKGHVAAFMILSLLPVVFLFLIFRRRFWRGIEI